MTFIIAEVGSNWDTLEDCYHAIYLAKRAGADAVKFQLFDEMALYGREGVNPTVAEYSMPKEWVPLLKAKADTMLIEFMISAFSPDLFHYVNPYVRRHKIASSCALDPTILAAVKETGKDTIISFGACTIKEMQWALEQLDKSKVTALYCNAAYPSRWHNLFFIEEMRENLKVPIGYSDHSLDVMYSPVTSVVIHGAVVLEKHFKSSALLIQTPDSPHSLDEIEFEMMVRAIKARGRDCRIPSPDESDMIKWHRNRPTPYGWKRICPSDQ